MSFSFRNFAVSAASLAIICFCSCERHHAAELAGEEEHVKSGAAEREQPTAKDRDARAKSHGDQTMSTTSMSVTPPPANPSPTSANFFPSASPH